MKRLYLLVIFLSLVFLLASMNSLPKKTDTRDIPYKSMNIYSFKKLRKYKGYLLNLKISNAKNQRILTMSKNSYKLSSSLELPSKSGLHPVVILLRGYVDKEIYTSGVGTKRVGEYLAKNGFITIAPDFLGYGDSSPASKDSLEERFQTYTTVLDLLDSLPNLNTALKEAGINDIQADINKVGLWGHSNGGHIALSVLAITGKPYPTVLWAPVSKPFPYSILYFTDEYPDNGKYLRKIIADFEEHHDIEKFNPVNYYKWIKAPIQIHQGVNDDAVPLDWSDELNERLSNLGLDVDYFTYDNADHNLMPDGWNNAVAETMLFLEKFLVYD